MQIGEYTDGRPLNYDEASSSFDVGGTPVTAQDVLGWDAAKQINWVSDELRDWAVGFGSTTSTTAEVPAASSAPRKEGRLFGFRSHKVWKMAIAAVYYLSIIPFVIVGVTSVPDYANSARDIIIDVVGNLMIALALLSPALLLSNFAYRDKLPLFKQRKPVTSAVGLALVVLVLMSGMASADNLHSRSYEVAREADMQERAAQRKAEEAAEKAEEEAKREAAEREAAEKRAEEEAAAKKKEEEAAREAEQDAAAEKAAEEAAAEKKAEDAAAAAKPAPAPAKTQTTEQYLKIAVEDVLGKETNMGDKAKVRSVEVSGLQGYYLVSLNANENFTNQMTKEGMWIDSKDVWEKVFTERSDVEELIIFWYFPLVDVKGNVTDEVVMKIWMTKANAADVNWDNVLIDNIPLVADEYYESPVFSN